MGDVRQSAPARRVSMTSASCPRAADGREEHGAVRIRRPRRVVDEVELSGATVSERSICRADWARRARRPLTSLCWSVGTSATQTTASAPATTHREREAQPGSDAAERDARSAPQPVADAAHRLDQLRLVRVDLELLPQVADVDVDRPRLPVGVVAPQRLEQRLPAEDAARAGGERAQELELDVRAAPPSRRAPPPSAGRDRRRRRRRGSRPARPPGRRARHGAGAPGRGSGTRGWRTAS